MKTHTINCPSCGSTFEKACDTRLFNLTSGYPVLLLGEGYEDVLVFRAMIKHLALTDTIQIAEYGGKTKLADCLLSLPARDGFRSLRAIGVTRDADTDYAAALSSVQAAIQNAQLPGTVQVKAFILPQAETSGALEALVLRAVTGTPAWPCVKAFATCVAEKNAESFSATDRDKHQLQAWLSTLPRPGLRLGEAASAGCIPFDHPAFQPLTDFIRSLVPAGHST